jgi:hypothetical protein
VAPFDLEAGFGRDFHLIKNGPVTLYRRREILDETTAWLAADGYQIVPLEAGAWTTQADFHRDVRTALDFPGYYGDNLDAFNDCLREVAMYEYGASRTATGTVLVLTGYDAFARREPRVAAVILDLFAKAARWGMLFGHRMLCLVQSDDPDISFDPVGATPVTEQGG